MRIKIRVKDLPDYERKLVKSELKDHNTFGSKIWVEVVGVTPEGRNKLRVFAQPTKWTLLAVPFLFICEASKAIVELFGELKEEIADASYEKVGLYTFTMGVEDDSI